jgi:hypothetical protein
MYFTRRHWALRIVDRIGLSRSSPAAAALVRVIIVTAEQTDQEMQAIAAELPLRVPQPPEHLSLLHTTTMLDRRPEPIEWLSQELGIPASEARRIIKLAGHTAQELLTEQQQAPV